MYEDVRTYDGKLLFKWDADKNAVEIIHKGDKDTVFLNSARKTYRVIRQLGRSPPGQTGKSDKPIS